MCGQEFPVDLKYGFKSPEKDKEEEGPERS